MDRSVSRLVPCTNFYIKKGIYTYPMEHLSIIRERYTCLLNFDVQLLSQHKLGQLIHSVLSVSDLPLPTVKSPNLVLPLPFQF